MTHIDERIVRLLEDHRKETRADFDKLETCLVDLTKATSQLATSTALMEDRYNKSDKEVGEIKDSIKGLGERMGMMEQEMASIKTAQTVSSTKASSIWKTLAIIGGAIVSVGAICAPIIVYLLQKAG